ncbi:MAG TPA: hypothetical protein VES20_09230 [Bryobacteraceae bacterium]|nr:hypothetical protein [Bryobacteraceae bacterium]
MIKRIAVLVMTTLIGYAQAPPPGAPESGGRVRRIVELKNLSGDRADRASRLLHDFMQPSGSLRIDSVLKVAVLHGPEDVVTGAEALLRKFDLASGAKSDNHVMFRFYLVEAAPDGSGGPIPPEITSAVEQMKKAFAYKSYRLVDTILLNSRNAGQAGVSGMLPAQGDRSDLRSYYAVSYDNADVVDDGRAVFVRRLRMNLKIPLVSPNGSSTQFSETSINSDLTVQEGQKLVLGKLSAEAGRSSIFVVVTADIQ